MTVLVDNTIITLLAYIRSPDFVPSEVPDLCLTFWASVLRSEPLVDQNLKSKSRSTPLEVYASQGKRVLQHAVFRGVVETVPDLLDMHPSYIEFVEDVVLSPLVLGAVFEKMDVRLMDGVTSVKEGFHAFVGAYWIRAFQDDQITTAWILKLLGPLIKRTESVVTNSKSKRYPRKAQSEISAKRFLRNLKSVLETQADVSMSTASSSSRSSIPPFDEWALSPLRPGALHHKRRQATPSSPGNLIDPRLAPVGFTEKDFDFPSLACFWPDTASDVDAMEEELIHLENARDVAILRTQEHESLLLPAFELSTIKETPFTNTSTDSVHDNDPSDIEVDDMFLTVDMINAESSPASRRPLTPRNTDEVPRKDKTKSSEDL
ncbi:hypothetical protein C8R46DRAFT_1070993 [Mycena filopes]|nr:hypothetical protein C8R46DRAFT_1070993 [Mycena filopes]